MNLRLTALSALVGISLAAFALPSNACFTVIVGKKVSSTGEILVGHNEDNEMRIIGSIRQCMKTESSSNLSPLPPKFLKSKRHWDFGGRRLWRLPAIHSPMAS